MTGVTLFLCKKLVGVCSFLQSMYFRGRISAPFFCLQALQRQKVFHCNSIPVLNSLLLKSKSFVPRWREWFAIGLLGLDSFFLKTSVKGVLATCSLIYKQRHRSNSSPSAWEAEGRVFSINRNWQKEVQDIIDALRINPVDYINENVLDLVAMIVIIVVYLLLIVHHPPL